jgi:hypothetical protein
MLSVDRIKIKKDGLHLLSSQKKINKAELKEILRNQYSRDVDTMIAQVKSILYREELSTHVLTGIRDIDRQILLNLDDADLYNVCLTNKYLKSLCDDDDFWKLNFIETYGKEKASRVELMHEDSLEPGETRWKRAYKDQKRLESYSNIYTDIKASKVMPFDPDYQAAKRVYDDFIDNSEMFYHETLDIIRKRDLPSYIKDGDILNGKILIDMGQYFMAPKFIDEVATAIKNMRIAFTKYSIYELFKHGPLFFKYVIQNIYHRHNRRYMQTTIQVQYISTDYPFYDQKKDKRVLNIFYDKEGNPLPNKYKNIKKYTYNGMTLSVPYNNIAY